MKEEGISKDFVNSLAECCFTIPLKLLTMEKRQFPQRKSKSYRVEEMDIKLKKLTNIHYNVLGWAFLIDRCEVSYILFIYILNKRVILVLLTSRHFVNGL